MGRFVKLLQIPTTPNFSKNELLTLPSVNPIEISPKIHINFSKKGTVNTHQKITTQNSIERAIKHVNTPYKTRQKEMKKASKQSQKRAMLTHGRINEDDCTWSKAERYPER
jgi:hypothetical protein